VNRIREIAEITWPVTYSSIISAEQIAFMLDWMYDKKTISTAIQAKNQDFLVLERDGIIVGFSGIEHNYENQELTRIHKLYVLPETQGTGAGKELLQAISNEARKRHSKKLHLNVNKANPAVQFYLHNGFIVDHEVILDIGNGFVMDDFVMTKEI
jgi:diamine N-acetyltransferase